MEISRKGKYLLILITILLSPLALIISACCITLYAIITIIFQPYFYKRDRKAFNESYKKALAKGVRIDFPPKIGHPFGIGSRFFRSFKISGDAESELFNENNS